MASTVTPHADMDPSPRVDVFIDAADLNVSTATITVHQISVAGDIEVRNMVGVASSGGFAATDYEPPLGVPVTYRVAQYSSGGAELGFALELTTQVDVADGMAVLSDPLVPGSAVMVEAHEVFGGELRRSRPTRVYRAGFRTVALMGMQSLLEDVPLQCQTKTLEDADKLEEVLAAGQVLVRLMPSGGRLPRILHVVIPSPVQVPVDVQYGGEWIKWDLTGVEVSRPTIDIIVPVLSYQLYIDYVLATTAGTYSDASALWSTYISAIRNPPPSA